MWKRSVWLVRYGRAARGRKKGNLGPPAGDFRALAWQRVMMQWPPAAGQSAGAGAGWSHRW